MAYLPRCLRPDELYFITSRTIDGAMFLLPTAATTNAIGAVLADAQSRYEVELFDFVFLSNHMHLVVRSRAGRIAEFMQYLKANIATEVNRILGRRGHLWERRYTASPILDKAAQVERAIYIYGHGVKEGLVAHAEQWPGLASVKERLSGRRPRHPRVDHSGLGRARFRLGAAAVAADAFTRMVSVTLAPWPFLEGLSKSAARRRVAELVAEAEARARSARGGKPALGAPQVLRQDPWDRPHRPRRPTPNPLCHAASPERRYEYREAYGRFVDDYRAASQRFRRGMLGTRFPMFAFPPPLPLRWTTARAGPAARAT